jgi:hypothetical protein
MEWFMETNRLHRSKKDSEEILTKYHHPDHQYVLGKNSQDDWKCLSQDMSNILCKMLE